MYVLIFKKEPEGREKRGHHDGGGKRTPLLVKSCTYKSLVGTIFESQELRVESEDNVLGGNDNNSLLGELNIRKTEWYITPKRPQDMGPFLSRPGDSYLHVTKPTHPR